MSIRIGRQRRCDWARDVDVSRSRLELRARESGAQIVRHTAALLSALYDGVEIVARGSLLLGGAYLTQHPRHGDAHRTGRVRTGRGQ